MHTGPLGSTIHVLRADAETVAELASIDWNRTFRRVYLDPVRGLITLMAPSRLHEEFSAILGHVVDIAASALTGAVKGLRNARLREPDSPPGTGMERPRTAPRRLSSSNVLLGLTPDDICKAIVGVRLSVTRDERTEAVAGIVRRRQRTGVRARETDTPYAARSG